MAGKQAFGTDVLFRLLKRMDQPERLIIVGGQAINFWARHYLPSSPELNEYRPFVSKDIDFYGDLVAAEELSACWEGTLYVASLDDHTPEIAKAVIPLSADSDDTVVIDVLGVLLGQDEQRIRRTAQKVPLSDDRCTFVMHPMLCMRGQFINVYGVLKRYQAPDSDLQLRRAELTVQIVRCLITELLESEHTRAALNVVEEVIAFATTEVALLGYQLHGHDAMSAVPSEQAKWPPAFRQRRWRQARKSVEAHRATYQRLHLKRQQLMREKSSQPDTN